MHKKIIQQLPFPLCKFSTEGRIRLVNRAFCRLVDRQEVELIGLPLDEVVRPLLNSRGFSVLWNAWEKRLEDQWQFIPLVGDQGMIAFQLSFPDKDGAVLLFRRKDFKEEEEADIRDDIHLDSVLHRVKNNFSLLLSIMDLQLSFCDSEEACAMVRRIRSRIVPIYWIQECMYRESGQPRIDIREYLTGILNRLSANWMMGNVRISTDFDETRLDPKRILPLGIILEELLVNTLKYAFAETKSREIDIECKQLNQRIVFRFRDNGCGIPGGGNPMDSARLGYTLIEVLTDQLDGQLDFCHNNGLEVKLTFAFGSGNE